MFRDKKYRISKFCNGCLWFAVRLSLALSGSLRLYLALSGSLWLSIALRICLQSPYLAHKALAQLAASLLRYNTLISPDFGYSGKWPNAFGQRDFGEQNQLNLFVMLPPYRESDCDGHKTVQWGDKSLFWWRPSYILQSRMGGSKFWRNWCRASFCGGKYLVSRKCCKTDGDIIEAKGATKSCASFKLLGWKRCPALSGGLSDSEKFPRRRGRQINILRRCWLADRYGNVNRADHNPPPAWQELDCPGGRWWKQSWLASPHGHRST